MVSDVIMNLGIGVVWMVLLRHSVSSERYCDATLCGYSDDMKHSRQTCIIMLLRCNNVLDT